MRPGLRRRRVPLSVILGLCGALYDSWKKTCRLWALLYRVSTPLKSVSSAGLAALAHTSNMNKQSQIRPTILRRAQVSERVKTFEHTIPNALGTRTGARVRAPRTGNCKEERPSSALSHISTKDIAHNGRS